MKKALLLIGTVLTLFACQSLEKKAEVIVQTSIKNNLYKPDTYQPIETILDSAFAPKDDINLFAEIDKVVELSSEMEKYESEIKFAKRSMYLWKSPYMSEFDRQHYNEAKQNLEIATANAERAKEKATEQLAKIINRLNEEKSFIGYKAYHRYRADNNAGNTLIGDDVVFIDKEVEHAVGSCSIERYKEYQTFIETLEEKISK